MDEEAIQELQTQIDEAKDAEDTEKVTELEGQLKEAQGTDDKEERIKELEEELAKEREKEKNFKGLKENEKGKRKKIGERVDEMEALLEKERENRQTLQDGMMSDAKEAALKQLAGEDKDMRAKLEERVKGSEVYEGVPQDSKELISRYEKAHGYLTGTQKRVNPLHSFNSVTGQVPEATGEKGFADSTEGKTLIESKFKKEIEKAKQNNPDFKI